MARLLISSVNSSGGKTTFTIALLRALINRGIKPSAFKCGPDYIDPRFHKEAVGALSNNLDSFFLSDTEIKKVYERNSNNDISIIEGVMGFYDGLKKSTKASSWDISRILEAPTILVINPKGASMSLAATIKGFLEFRENNIIGVIFNKCKKALYEYLKDMVEEETGIKVFGYIELNEDIILESRHLGLKMDLSKEEIERKIDIVSKMVEETVNIDEILKVIGYEKSDKVIIENKVLNQKKEFTIGIAKDDAFCFYYNENIRKLKKYFNIEYFSPLYDNKIGKYDAIYLGGGYPELYAKELSENKTMLKSIKKSLEDGLICIAECGGYIYLHNKIESIDGNFYELVSFFDAVSKRRNRLRRFGYIEIEAREENIIAKEGEKIKAHEFHYWDSNIKESAFIANKPNSKINYMTGIVKKNTIAGFSHMYFGEDEKEVLNLINKCKERKNEI